MFFDQRAGGVVMAICIGIVLFLGGYASCKSGWRGRLGDSPSPPSAPAAAPQPAPAPPAAPAAPPRDVRLGRPSPVETPAEGSSSAPPAMPASSGDHPQE